NKRKLHEVLLDWMKQENEGLHRKMSENSRQEFVDKYDERRNLVRLEEIYQDIIQKSKNIPQENH
ncbi:MAG: hypothetical protein KBS85_01480, partial [Lachnospiraceae bacterium]|nr:hypothetical protein [Candidatus Merdinaster equi]